MSWRQVSAAASVAPAAPLSSAAQINAELIEIN
jgi:hypothetical protein